MCPVNKTSAVAGELGAGAHLVDQALVNRLNKENIWELLSNLPGEFTKQDILDHLKFKHSQLGDLIQNFQTYSTQGEPQPPKMAMMADMSSENAFMAEDELILAELISQTLKGKAATTSQSKSSTAGSGGKFSTMGTKSSEKAGEDGAPGDGAPAGSQVVGGAIVAEGESLLSEVQDFLTSFNDKVFEIQLQGELSKKNAELLEEIQRIIAMVRSGKIDAVFLLVALAKYNCSKNGLIFTQYGQRMFRLNDQSNTILQELYGPKGGDFASVQMITQKQKEIAQSQQMLMQDMQKITQNIESTMSFAKSAIDEIFKTRLHIINAPFKNL